MMQKKNALTDHVIIPELAERWSPRAFADKPVEELKIKQVLEAARWAASSNNEQPWRFFIAQKGKGDFYNKLQKGLNQWNKKWTWTAPVLGVTLAKKNFSKNERPNQHAWHDLGLAMGNLSAQATHLNLYLHQMAGIDYDFLYDALKIPRETYDVVSMFAMGYQDEKRLDELEERYREPEESYRSRKALTELIFEGQFGLTPEWIKTDE
jgi:nitroreductase